MSQTSVIELLEARNVLAEKQRQLLVEAITNVNMRTRELLKNDFGSTLVRNCAWDVADTLAVRFFKTADFYLSPQQLYHRIVSFSYEDPYDPLAENATLRKLLYENKNGAETLNEIATQVVASQAQLFPDDRDSAATNAQRAYREDRKAKGTFHDDITGRSGTLTAVIKNGKVVYVSDIQADHVLPYKAFKYSTRYTDPEQIERLERFVNSDKNFWLMHASANAAKSDVRVCLVDGKVEFMNGKAFQSLCEKGKCTPDDDITWKASAEQMADGTIALWEKKTDTGKKVEKLKEKGYLDEDGKVTQETREKLIERYRKAMDEESLLKLLPHKNEETGEWETITMYEKVAADAAQVTKAAAKRIIAGQVIYYVLPPLVFETKTILKKKNMTLERFFADIKKAGKRVIAYIQGKLGEIFKNILGNALNKFIKTFFDIIISLVRETIRRILQIIKQVVLSLVNCVKIIADKKSTGAQKADSVMKLMTSTVVTVVLEVLFEYLEKQFNLPDILMEPLQVIVTILATNLVMLALQKADLFDVQYGLLVSNIDAVFAEERQQFLSNSEELLNQSKSEMNAYMDHLKEDIEEIKQSLSEMDFFQVDATADLERLNKTFEMGIDFCQEWQDFCQTGVKTEVEV